MKDRDHEIILDDDALAALQELVQNRSLTPKRYSMAEQIIISDFIIHDKFGHGLVQKINSSTVMEVLFEDKARKMIYNHA